MTLHTEFSASTIDTNITVGSLQGHVYELHSWELKLLDTGHVDPLTPWLNSQQSSHQLISVLGP